MNRLTFIRLFTAVCGLLFISSPGFAQPQSRSAQLIQVLVSPDKPDWTYALGEEASFEVTVLRHQVPINDVTVSYRIGLEKMAPTQSGEARLSSGSVVVGKKATLDT